MKSVVISVIAVSLVSGVCGMISRDKSSMKLVSSLCLICVLISPVKSVIAEIKQTGKAIAENTDRSEIENDKVIFGEKFAEIYSEYGTGGISDAVKNEVCKRFSINADECRVKIKVSYTDGNIALQRITLIFSGKAKWKDPHVIEEYVAELCGCECVSAVE